MTQNEGLFETNIPGLPLIGRGKVRDIYAVGENHLLIVATDRLSAYDVVLPDPIPGKGEILTRISTFWFRMMQDIVPNHLSSMSLDEVIGDSQLCRSLAGRAVIVRRLEPLPIEAVVRGYLIGSGWRDYQRSGAVCGIRLPQGLAQAGRLPQTLFTPATKAPSGQHDENISFEAMCATLGEALACRVRDVSLAIYERAAAYALDRDIIIADTKFEFGLDANGTLYVIDEMLTPDSSRFWPGSSYKPGISPPSFDKQFVRDYLDTLDWDKTPPGPRLPRVVLEKTAQKYRDAFTLLTGETLGRASAG